MTNKAKRVSIKVSERALSAIRKLQRPYEDRMEQPPSQFDIVDSWLDSYESVVIGGAVTGGDPRIKGKPDSVSNSGVDKEFAVIHQRAPDIAKRLRGLIADTAKVLVKEGAMSHKPADELDHGVGGQTQPKPKKLTH